MQCFVKIGEIALEEFEKVGLRHFANVHKKTEGGNWAYMRDSAQFNERVDIIFECATVYVSYKPKNGLSLIIAPPSGRN